jgi:hypothetical protein
MPLPVDAEVKPFEKCGGTSNVSTACAPLSKGFENATEDGITPVSSEGIVAGLSACLLNE